MIEASLQPTPAETASNPDQFIGPYERLRLGGDELAICGVIDLGLNSSEEAQVTQRESNSDARFVVLDVGFRSDGSRFGPYDLDGTGKKYTFEKPYVLVQNVIDTEGNSELRTYEFDANEPVQIGRSKMLPSSEVFSLDDDHISRVHAEITVNNNGGLKVKDSSVNGTLVTRPGQLVGDIEADFGYTQSIDDFLHQAGRAHLLRTNEDGKKEYAGRHLVNRDTAINRGVYVVGGRHGEALVIDDEKYPKELNDVYLRVTEAIQNQHEKPFNPIRALKKAIRQPEGAESVLPELESVFGVVSDVLRYDIAATDELARDGQKIALNSYISEGVGVCRTQATLCAYVIERMIGDGMLKGRVSIDRNEAVVDGRRGGHAWARFADESGQVFIIDPAQKYVGSLEVVSDKGWAYRRTEDVLKVLLVA